ncbi:MAG: glycoside hydrolase family 43 protein [Chitinophagaceae bacterium]
MMQNRLLFFGFVFCRMLTGQTTLAQALPTNPAGTYSNPLTVKLGDPYMLYADSTYFLFGTGSRNGFPAYQSSDMVNWKSIGQVYTSDSVKSWGIGSFWAPEVYKVKNKYYLFFSAQWRNNPANDLENFRIGVAVSDKPGGPYTDLSKKPVFDPGYPIIDANVFFDENGRCYLYYSRCCYKHAVVSGLSKLAKEKGWFSEIEESWVYGVEIKPDFSGIIGEPVLILRPPVSMDDKQAEWESRSVTSREVNRRWTEGSVTFRKDNLYYIMYSANNFAGQHYAVGYAVASSPLGPFKKAANNPILQKNTGNGGVVSGTGHNNIVWSPDGKEMFCVYHARTAATGNERVVFIDRMQVQNGKIRLAGPTTSPQPLPSGIGSPLRK